MRKELRQRLATEFRYAITKMQEVPQPARKLFYFSVLFGESQRILNLEWDRELSLVYTITQHVHTQVTAYMQAPGALGLFPINLADIMEKLTRAASDLTAYFEKRENDASKEEMYQTLERLAEIAYIVTGNGSYLSERGAIKQE